MTDRDYAAMGRKGGKKGGPIGGKATGQSKNRMKHLTPEQRSERMKAVRRGKKANGEV